MTIYDETRKSSKYNTLLYVEFLEMLSRLGHVAGEPDNSDPIAFKVQDFLEELWENCYDLCILKESEDELKRVDLGYVVKKHKETYSLQGEEPFE